MCFYNQIAFESMYFAQHFTMYRLFLLSVLLDGYKKYHPRLLAPLQFVWILSIFELLLIWAWIGCLFQQFEILSCDFILILLIICLSWRVRMTLLIERTILIHQAISKRRMFFRFLSIKETGSKETFFFEEEFHSEPLFYNPRLPTFKDFFFFYFGDLLYHVGHIAWPPRTEWSSENNNK